MTSKSKTALVPVLERHDTAANSSGIDESSSYFAECWAEQLQERAYPSFLRSIVRIDANEFVATVKSADRKTARDIIDSILSGDAYVLKNAHSEDEIDSLRQRIFKWRNGQAQADSERILEGRPDYHKINDVEMIGPHYYQTYEHAHGFFRWNGDPLGIFAMIDPYWAAIKLVSGNPADAFHKATPVDGIIDKLAVYQYPMTIGGVSKHYDPPAHQKLLFNLLLSKVGRDYGYGECGFYAVDGDSGKNIYLEHTMNFGDYICVCPTVHHGATPAQPVNGQPDEVIDWESDRGRWLLAALAVPSHHVENRLSTVAVND